MKLRHALVTAGALACLSIPLVASPAAASSIVTGNCTGTGVYGAFTGYYISATEINPLRLRVLDTSADGHHVAIRVITYNADYDKDYWPWHHYYGGNGGELIYDTSAFTLDGIEGIQIQAGRFEGSTYLNGCTSFPQDNPYSS